MITKIGIWFGCLLLRFASASLNYTPVVAVLELLWTCSGPVLDQHWNCAWPVLTLHWIYTGSLLDLCWICTDLYWICLGPVTFVGSVLDVE